jgi:hypothetical protein
VDGGRPSVEIAGAEGISGASVRKGVGVLGADDRGVPGHAAIILLPSPHVRVSTQKFRRALWSRRCRDQEALVGVWMIERAEQAAK